MKWIISIILFVLFSGSAPAFLPPDAPLRQQEIIRYRVQARAEQAEREVELAHRIVESDRKARKILACSPWIDTKTVLSDPVVVERQKAEMERVQRQQQMKRRWIVSLCVLTILGAVVWRVRVLTEPRRV